MEEEAMLEMEDDLSIFDTSSISFLSSDDQADNWTDSLIDSSGDGDGILSIFTTNLPMKRQKVSKMPIRKRIRDRRVIKVPRLVKDDIRRHYSTMFSNVMNSTNPHFFASFLQEYTAPSLTMTKSFANSNTDRFHLHGVKEMATYWSLMFQLSPDMVVTRGDVKLTTYSNTAACKLETDFIVHVTHIYKVHPFDLIDLVLKKYFHSTIIDEECDQGNHSQNGGRKRKVPDDAPPTRETFTFPDITYELMQIYGSEFDSLLTYKPSVKMRGKLVIIVNENKYIEGFRFMLSPEGPIAHPHANSV